MLAQIFDDRAGIIREITPVFITLAIVLGVLGIVAMYFYYKTKKDKEK